MTKASHVISPVSSPKCFPASRILTWARFATGQKGHMIDHPAGRDLELHIFFFFFLSTHTNVCERARAVAVVCYLSLQVALGISRNGTMARRAGRYEPRRKLGIMKHLCSCLWGWVSKGFPDDLARDFLL